MVEGHYIYIKNQSMTAMEEQVEKEFKSFGPIKRRGVQVRSNKGFCFAFVEFEQLSSMQNAVKAGLVTIASRQVYIEEKSTTTREAVAISMEGVGSEIMISGVVVAISVADEDTQEIMILETVVTIQHDVVHLEDVAKATSQWSRMGM
ncbi:uncharacterized protein LOC113344300 isoform X1 [Papaver somniferum]|uniref:uncharacterized protein LOC113344300 isoform X1 n=1 Tax=Papaver somniferum TaxID=3469 RepID=UPI000E6FF8A4|nr:uncharacterized protein LOC113344300 isoform X1 [Papaver somniferum]XP_026444089.1 uncharacterized protein LOC113344300 isoform X1 [Papaver somniferum]